MKKLICYLLFTYCFAHSLQAQTSAPWNGKRCAVVLTYDDALNVHLNNAVPTLDSFGLKATFYLSDYFGGLNAQIPKWKKAAANGHELANHTTLHPCTGGIPGRDWVNPEYDLSKYSFRRINDDIQAMNNILKAIDGQDTRTFAFPCSDTKIRDTPYFDGVKDKFIAARAVRSEMLSINNTDLFNVSSYMINGETGEQLITLVKEAMAQNKLVVFLFHGVGGEHGLNVSLPAHRQLLQFLKQNQKQIWIAPMRDVAMYIKDQQGKTAQTK